MAEGLTSGSLLSRKEALWLIIATATLTPVVCLLPPQTYLAEEWLRMHSLYRGYANEVLASGSLPLWNPYCGLGRPFFGDIETATLYPPNLLLLPLAVNAGLVISTTLHAILLIMGMVLLARSFSADRFWSIVVAYVFLCGGTWIGRLHGGHVTIFHTFSHTPLLAFLAVRLQDSLDTGVRYPVITRKAIVIGAVSAHQFLAGNPHFFWISCFGIGLLLIGRHLALPLWASTKRVVSVLVIYACSLALAMGLSALQLLPFLELAAHGNRVPSIDLANAFSLKVRDALSIWLPSEPSRLIDLEYNLYAGILVAVTAFIALANTRDRNVRALLFAAAATLLSAIGKITPFFYLFYYGVPGYAHLRLHSRTAVWLALALTLLAAVVLSHARKWPVARVKAALASGVAIALTVVLVAAMRETDAIDRGWWIATRLIAWLLAAATAWLWLIRFRASPSPRLAWLVVAAIVLDLGYSGYYGKNQYVLPVALRDETHVRETLEQMQALEKGAPPPRVSFPPEVIRENSGLEHRYSSYAYYCALSPARIWHYLHERQGVPVDPVLTNPPSHALYRRAPIPYDDMNLRLGFDWRSKRAIENRNPDPRAFLCFAAKPVANWQEALKARVSGHDPHAIALLEESDGSADQYTAGESQGKAQIVHFEPERIVVSVETEAPGILVLSETWFPGWWAEFDETRSPCIPANVWMRAVHVPEGKRTITLVYEPTSLRVGLLISVAAALLAAAMFALTYRGSRKAQAPQSEEPSSLDTP